MGLMKRNNCDSRTKGMQTMQVNDLEWTNREGMTILKGIGFVTHPDDEMGVRHYLVTFRGIFKGEYATQIQAQAALEMMAMSEWEVPVR